MAVFRLDCCNTLFNHFWDSLTSNFAHYSATVCFNYYHLISCWSLSTWLIATHAANWRRHRAARSSTVWINPSTCLMLNVSWSTWKLRTGGLFRPAVNHLGPVCEISCERKFHISAQPVAAPCDFGPYSLLLKSAGPVRSHLLYINSYQPLRSLIFVYLCRVKVCVQFYCSIPKLKINGSLIWAASRIRALEGKVPVVLRSIVVWGHSNYLHLAYSYLI